MKKTLPILVSILVFIGVAVFGQNNAEQTKIKDYLESNIQNKNTVIITQNVAGIDIIESSLTINTGNEYNNTTLQRKFFIKTFGEPVPYNNLNDLLASSQFIEMIHLNKFKFVSEEAGVNFQSMLTAIDNERGLGFFQENDTWYFIRSKFFDDIRAYVVTTSEKNGNIKTIVYKDEFKKALPETLLRSGETIRNTSSKTVISKKDSVFMCNYLFDKSNYEFEISPLNFYSINKISTISLNKCNLKITEAEGDWSQTSNHQFMLISNNNEYIKQENVNDLLEMPLFIKSLQKKYTLKTEDDARLFQYVLDDLNPVSKFDIELKTFYKKDNMWFFVREKRFDDIQGYILVVDKKNKVSYMEYTTISEESILRIKMKDPNFKVNDLDYKFKLVQPTTNKVTLKKGEVLSVEINFDEAVVHASGCWILTHRDGRVAGTYGGNSIHSPFISEIPSESLENEHHTFEYFLLKNETQNPEDALGVIKVEIEVK